MLWKHIYDRIFKFDTLSPKEGVRFCLLWKLRHINRRGVCKLSGWIVGVARSVRTIWGMIGCDCLMLRKSHNTMGPRIQVACSVWSGACSALCWPMAIGVTFHFCVWDKIVSWQWSAQIYEVQSVSLGNVFFETDYARKLKSGGFMRTIVLPNPSPKNQWENITKQHDTKQRWNKQIWNKLKSKQIEFCKVYLNTTKVSLSKPKIVRRMSSICLSCLVAFALQQICLISNPLGRPFFQASGVNLCYICVLTEWFLLSLRLGAWFPICSNMEVSIIVNVCLGVAKTSCKTRVGEKLTSQKYLLLRCWFGICTIMQAGCYGHWTASWRSTPGSPSRCKGIFRIAKCPEASCYVNQILCSDISSDIWSDKQQWYMHLGFKKYNIDIVPSLRALALQWLFERERERYIYIYIYRYICWRVSFGTTF